MALAVGRAVRAAPTARLVAQAEDDGADPPAAQVVPDRWPGIALVARDPVGPDASLPARARHHAARDQGLDLGRFLPLPPSQYFGGPACRAPRHAGAVSSRLRPCCGRGRDRPARRWVPLCRPRRVRVRPNHRVVKAVQRPVHIATGLRVGLEHGQDAVPDAPVSSAVCGWRRRQRSRASSPPHWPTLATLIPSGTALVMPIATSPRPSLMRPTTTSTTGATGVSPVWH
jgi:hypothetical protein